MEVNESAFMKDIWSVIVKHTHLYDTIFLRASSKWLNKLCKEYRPFPKYYVLDQDECMTYLIKIGSTSCLDYVKNTLHFTWTSEQSIAAVRCGQIEVLKHLRSNGCLFDQMAAVIECTQHTCSLDMIKYLLESGSSWQDPVDNSDEVYENYVSNMATHGHIDCIKYAIQTGCTNKKVYYTPSMECLEFLIQHQFDFFIDGEFMDPWSVTEYAATHGDFNMMKYAHQNGLPINTNCVYYAADRGKAECLKYALENTDDKDYVPGVVSTIECFKCIMDKFGKEKVEENLSWDIIGQTNVEYLQYIIDSGISLPTADHKFQMLIATAAASFEMMKFILDHMPTPLQSEGLSSDLYSFCAKKGNLEGLKFLFNQKVPSNVQRVIGDAISSTDIKLIKWVWNQFPNKEEQGFDIQNTLDVTYYMTPEVIDFLVEHGAKLTSEHLFKVANVGNLQTTAHLTRIGCQFNDFQSKVAYSSLCLKYLRERSNANTKK